MLYMSRPSTPLASAARFAASTSRASGLRRRPALRYRRQPARAARLEVGGEQIAEVSVRAFGGDPRDHEVTRLDLLGRHVQHPVVARLQQDGDRRPAACAPA